MCFSFVAIMKKQTKQGESKTEVKRENRGGGVRRKGISQRAAYYPGYKICEQQFPMIQREISDKLGFCTTNGVMMVLMCYVSSC